MTPGGVLPALASALAARQRATGTGALAEANAAALGRGARAVVTGQQPGLFGGPLLVLLKAAGAIAHAERRTRDGVPTVPVFWVASDDHDWDEASHSTVMDGSGSPRVVRLAGSASGKSLCDVALDAVPVDRALADLAAALPSTPRALEAIALARPAALPTDLGAWFTTTIVRLLGDCGLVVVEPRDLAPHAGAFFERLVESADSVQAAVRDASRRRRDSGLAAPLDPAPGLAPLFLRDEPGGRRLRVAFEGDRVMLRGEPSPWDRASLARHVHAHPELASADVVGRVLLQDALLPVDAYVAGPTEAHYLAQIADAHLALGLTAPPVVPRPSAAFVERKHAETLRAHRPHADARTHVVDGGTSADADPLAGAIERIRGEVEALSHDPASTGSVAAALTRAQRELRDAIVARLKSSTEGHEAVRGRVLRAMDVLMPRGKPQERVLSPLSIVARHGVEALRRALRFAAAAPRDEAGPALVVLD